MTYAAWCDSVNTRFFKVSNSYDDNSVSTGYASGRKAVFLKNTRFQKTTKCSLSLSMKNGEYSAFWTWYTDVLGGTAGAFTCPALGSGFFRFKSAPSESAGLLRRTIEMEIEEAY